MLEWPIVNYHPPIAIPLSGKSSTCHLPNYFSPKIPLVSTQHATKPLLLYSDLNHTNKSLLALV